MATMLQDIRPHRGIRCLYTDWEIRLTLDFEIVRCVNTPQHLSA